MAFASKWKTKEDAAKHGLKIGSIKGIGGILRFESPVSLNATEFSGGCSVGHLTYIGNGSRVSMSDIGRFCAIAPSVEIGPSEHPTDWMSIHPFQYKGTRQFSEFGEYEGISGAARFTKNSGRTSIGNDVWIGDGAFIRRGVKIGDGAIIAARAVVTKDVEPYSIVGGNPARPIRKRFDESIIERFLNVKWWEYNLAPLQASIDYASPTHALTLLEEQIGKGLPKLQPTTYEVAGGSVLSARRL